MVFSTNLELISGLPSEHSIRWHTSSPSTSTCEQLDVNAVTMLNGTVQGRLSNALHIVLRAAACVGHTRPLSAACKFAMRPRSILHHPFSTSCILPESYSDDSGASKPGTYKNIRDMYDQLNPPEDWPRTLILKDVPNFTLEEDVRQLFAESGFPV
jgi:hypothetical protein